MTTYRFCGAAALAVIAATTAAGCGTMRVNAYEWPGARVTSYRTFAWDRQDRFATGDPRLDNNEIMLARVRQSIERELTARRLELAPAGDADVLVHVHATVDQRVEAGTLDRDPARCEPGGCGPFVYDAGTLLLDLVDRRTNRVAWRGWAEGSLDAAVDDQARLEELIDKTVAKILARLPRAEAR